MPWNTPPVPTTGTVISVAGFATPVANDLSYLLNLKQVFHICRAGTANYTLTGAGATTYNNVDATNLLVTMTSAQASGRVRCFASFYAQVTTPASYAVIFDFLANGVASQGAGANGLWLYGTPGAAGTGNGIQNGPVSMEWIFDGTTTTAISPSSSYTFALGWKTQNTLATATVYNNINPITFVVEEL